MTMKNSHISGVDSLFSKSVRRIAIRSFLTNSSVHSATRYREDIKGKQSWTSEEISFSV